MLTQFIKELKAFQPFNDWQNGRIYKSVGSIAAQDEGIAVPVTCVHPDTESEKTTPSQNSNLEVSFGVAIFFDVNDIMIPLDEPTIMSVVDALKSYLYERPRQSLVEEGTGQALAQKIKEFKDLSYDTITFDDGSTLGVCPITVTYLMSVKTVTRQPSVSTT